MKGVKMRSSWVGMGPKSNDKDSCERWKQEKTQRRGSGEDGGHSGSCGTTGKPKMASRCQELEERQEQILFGDSGRCQPC